MEWIESIYRMLWTEHPPERREYDNALTAYEHCDFVSGVVKEMMASGAVTLLPEREKPWVVSPLGVVPKKGTDKFRLTVNMRYVNRHLGEKKFRMEGMKDLAEIAEGGPRGIVRPYVGILSRGTPSRVKNLRWVQVGGHVLHL